MANIYVWSGAGGTATGASWANACLTLTAGITASATGDTIWVASDHVQTQASALSLTPKATAASPQSIIAASRAGSVPPVPADWVANSAQITTTGAFAITVNQPGAVYVFGIIWSQGTGVASLTMGMAAGAGRIQYEQCTFNMPPSSGTSIFNLTGSSSTGGATYKNCAWTFGTTTSTFATPQSVAKIIGGSIALTGTVPTTLVGSAFGQGPPLVFDGVNLSALGSGKTLVGNLGLPLVTQFVNCELGASVTVAATPTTPSCITQLIVSDSSTSNSRQEIYDYPGGLTTETTIVRTGGATNGTTPMSWKVATNANISRPAPFQCFDMAIWNATTGSSKTVTVEIVNDGTTLTNGEAWIEVEYLGSSSFPISTLITSGAAMVGTATNLPTSSVTWTTTGITTPVKQYMQVTITPQMVGLIRVSVKLARASKTVYVDPAITVA